MNKSRFSRQNRNQGITSIEDDVIRGTFKNYDKNMSTITEEEFKMCKPTNCDSEVFCGWFKVRIYVAGKLMGHYKFDCTSFNVPYFTEDGNEQTKVTKIG